MLRWPKEKEGNIYFIRYYEVRVLNADLCQIGWVRDGFEPDEDGGVGDDECTGLARLVAFFFVCCLTKH